MKPALDLRADLNAEDNEGQVHFVTVDHDDPAARRLLSTHRPTPDDQ